jgi:hypothetical protein
MRLPPQQKPEFVRAHSSVDPEIVTES